MDTPSIGAQIKAGLAETLKNYRQQNDLSQAQLGLKLGIGKNQVSKLETLKSGMDFSTLLERLLRIGINPMEFVGKVVRHVLPGQEGTVK